MSVLVINAINLRDGGGLTHLIELLRNVDFEKYIFKKVIIVGSDSTISKISNKNWLQKESHYFLNSGFLGIQCWRIFYFKRFLIKNRCDLLFDPGGGYSGSFRPYVTMCRNMLVFEHAERNRYKYSLVYFRLLILKTIQFKSFQNASGIIFISNYAKLFLERELKFRPLLCHVINHGVSPQFDLPVKQQKDIKKYSSESSFKLLYVSIIDLYKHQDKVAEAVLKLREVDMFPIELSFVGPIYKPAFDKLKKWMSPIYGNSVKYLGKIDYNNLNDLYKNSDAFIFASSCENMPNILIEAMRSGLPICCSNKGPMPEFLETNGFYFDPENVESIYKVLKEMILNPIKRQEKAMGSKACSYKYTWNKCASETFFFLDKFYTNVKNND